MIYYVKNENNGGVIYPENKVVARSALGVIKELCKQNLFSLDGYLKATSEILGMKHKIPIVVSDCKVFFYTKGLKNYDSIFVNFIAIEHHEKHNLYTRVHFKTGETLDLDLKYDEFKKISNRIFKIFKYRESLV